MTPRSAAAGLRCEPAEFVVRLSSTPRGARLARRLAEQQLAAWGIPYGSDTARAVALVTAELASNAITHGRLPGRDFRLALTLMPHAVRIEVTDTRPERLLPDLSPARIDSTAGRGLLLVDAYAQRWGCSFRDAYTKTVWAEAVLPSLLCTSQDCSAFVSTRPSGLGSAVRASIAACQAESSG